MTEDKKDENIISSNENEENKDKVGNQPVVDENLDNPSTKVSNEKASERAYELFK